MKASRYSIRRTVPLAYDEAVARTKEALSEQGFGVLCEIDLRQKLHEKLGVEFKRYVILGACNPPLAYKALQAEPEIGLLLPCNVIVYETGEKSSAVAAIEPGTMLEVIGDNPAMAEVAQHARLGLEKALESIA